MPESSAAPSFDAPALARSLLRQARHGALSTTDSSGHPFASLVALATDHDGAPIIITSHLSGHTGHLERDPRAALLVADVGRGDPLAHPRLTLTVRAAAVRPEDPGYAHLRGRYLRRNPKADLYVDLPGFWFWRLEPVRAALNGGFGKAWSGTWADLATDLADADALLAAEAGAVEHMNADHADAVRLYATTLCGQPDGPWRVSGIDPDGIDLVTGDAATRLAFPSRITGPGPLRAALKDLADAARAADLP